MYLDRFRLARAPFDVCADPAQVYVGEEFGTALAGLGEVLVAGSDTVGLVIAPDGYGKSTLIDRMIDDLHQATLWSRVRGAWSDPDEFLRAVVLGFGFDECSASHTELRHILEVFLTHQSQRKNVPLLIVDDAHCLKPKMFEELRWLAGLKVEERGALKIILSGLPELERIVRAPAMEWLAARHRVHVEVHALSEQESSAYIVHRLATAGALDPGQVFDPGAVAFAYRYTGGIPGLLNTLCETAMSCAAALGHSQVTAAHVDSAVGKLRRVSDSGITRVQGMRASDAKASKDDELGHLIVTSDDKPVRDYRITRERVLIGRGRHNDVHLDRFGVSRYHALLLLDPRGWMLIDLQSTNGTQVNGQRIRQQRLQDRDEIGIADLRIRVMLKFTPTLPQDGSEDGDKTVITAKKVPNVVELQQPPKRSAAQGRRH